MVRAYPRSSLCPASDGVWLSVYASILGDSDIDAQFVIAIPKKLDRKITAWAFWVHGENPKWIGSRHTNFMPDSVSDNYGGSICVSSVDVQESIVELIDMYAVWAFRHVHDHVVGYWPGPHLAASVHERRTEFKSLEYCGCGSGRKYGLCCRANDFGEFGEAQVAREHAGSSVGNERTPPRRISSFVNEHVALPDSLVDYCLPQQP